MKVDRDRVLAYITEIRASIDTLRNYAKLDRQAFLSSPITIRDTRYCFIIACQAAIDLCYHLNARLTKKAPTDYSNCFELLGESAHFNKEILKKMALMARLRNLLVHHYIKVDNERVYEKLKEIDCFEDFIKELETIIEN
ncbi:MAG: hypothetical protein SCARUB_03766 [Candidatus Scalindua rubra]|uniref:DUF86 domain-containing protein n=1 Tax=Candidatus Scalindua rubra TaxID=1872076 RepID=A0A1E3X639_9BACT|nr:MAG: hypothetical protein SCARUB_03766 [Candidatus Scalindua rubra]